MNNKQKLDTLKAIKREYLNSDNIRVTGLCYIGTICYHLESINYSQLMWFRLYFKEECKKEGIHTLGYYWSLEYVESRLEWLDKHIKLFENEKA